MDKTNQPGNTTKGKTMNTCNPITTTGTGLVYGIRAEYTCTRPTELRHLATTVCSAYELDSGPLDAPAYIACGSATYRNLKNDMGRSVVCQPIPTALPRQQ